MNEEFERSRAERKRLREMDQQKRLKSEKAVRLVLDDHFPGGAPEDLLERICLIQNGLIKEIVLLEKVVREMHDGIHLVAEGAAERWIEGFEECARQVRAYGEELDLPGETIDSLLRNQVRRKEEEEAAKNRAATQQVEWSRT